MNVDLFKSLLKSYWESNSTTDFDDAAEKIATAYHLSNIGSTQTFFGARLINGDKDTLKSFLSLGMKVNFLLKFKSKDVTPGFKLMSLGFCLYWSSAVFSPVPPLPPIIAPTTGVKVIFPGVPLGLDKGLKESFDNTTIDATLDSLSTVLKLHLLTISGIYAGTTLVGTVPTPMVLPWTSLLGN
jgi:hypothetical protein